MALDEIVAVRELVKVYPGGARALDGIVRPMIEVDEVLALSEISIQTVGHSRPAKTERLKKILLGLD